MIVNCLRRFVLLDADLVLAGAEQGEVRLEDAGQQLALGADLVVDELDVVVDVAEVVLQHPRHARVDAALDRRQRGQQRVDRAVKLNRLALQQVDALGLVALALEYAHLGILDVLGQPLDDRRVVVDHGVEHGPDDRDRSGHDEIRPLLEACARGPQLARRAVADRDRVPRRREDVDLSEIDLLLFVVIARGPQDDEVMVLVILELGPLVGGAGVLDRQLVHRESIGDLLHLLGRRVMDAEPDEALVPGDAGRRLGNGYRPPGLAGPALVMGTVDDHVRAPGWAFGSARQVPAAASAARA